MTDPERTLTSARPNPNNPARWIPPDEPAERGIYLCKACRLFHPDVECAGIYYCPNPLCTAAGGAPHRHAFDQNPTLNQQSIDVAAWLAWGEGLQIEDPEIRKARDYQALLIRAKWLVGREEE